jgi:hypothetical protein
MESSADSGDATMMESDADAAPPTTDADSGPTNVEAQAPDADSGQPASDASDGGGDVVADAGPDVSDSSLDGAAEGSADAAPDVVDNSAMFAFPGQVVTTLCKQIQTCCFGDAGTPFKAALCASDNIFGIQGSNTGVAFLDAGHVVFNPTKANNCLADITAIDCRTSQLTTADQMALVPDCFGALQGTLPLGASCKDSIECLPGETCVPGDGGALSCQPIRSANANCSDFGTPAIATNDVVRPAESICSYRGSGNTGLVCEFEDRVTGNPLPDGGWTCVAAGPLDSPCGINLDCTSLLCETANGLYACKAAVEFTDPVSCQRYNAGDGG